MFEKFIFRSFKPFQDIILYANSKLSQIMEFAPADAACQATMAKVGNNYLSEIEINSGNGRFKAEAQAQDPRVCLDILDERIKQRIKDWKSLRFATQLFGKKNRVQLA